MLGTALRADIKEMIDRREWDALREGLSELDPADGAELLADLPPEECAVVMRLLPRTQLGDLFEQLPVEEQANLVQALSSEQVEQVLNDMPPDDRTRLLEELPAAVVQRALQTLHPDELRIARRLLGYPEGSAGRVMTPEYVALPALMTCAQALGEIRKQARRAETVAFVYLVDERGRLVDDIELSAIVLADPDVPLASIADGNFTAVVATDSQGDVVRLFEKYDRFALPVTDSTGVLVGIITADDVLDVAEREATEDIQKLGGSEALDAPYLEVGFWEMVKKRGVWLAVLLLGEMLTASAMGRFEGEIARAAVVALFVPLIISSGGNSGSQATSIIIRSLALQELRLSDWHRVFWREAASGLTLGLILGVIGLVRIVVWHEFGWQDYSGHPYLMGITVWASLAGVVMFGSLAGSMLPFLLRRLGLDPASASAPFVATLVDVTGLVLYFGIASAVLRGTLL
ncbi:MAG: magnesium transporter [Pseudomonadota bacterium]|jgi:magnesium transporter